MFLIYAGSSFGFIYTPKSIDISAQYNGMKLYVSGEVRKSENVVVEILGSTKDSHFKQKGKVWGIFWMTVAHLTFKNAPTVFMVSVPGSLLNSLKDLGIDFKMVLSKIKIEPEPDNRELILRDFLKLKQKEGLYYIKKGGVHYEVNGDVKTYQAVFDIPSKMPPGTYNIVVYKLDKNNKIYSKEESSFKVRLVGLPKFISDMAFNHSLLYGVLAVIIAIGAGFLMGVIFRDKGGAH